MQIKKPLFLLLPIFMIGNMQSAPAQNISGKVVNKDGFPIEYAGVLLFSRADSSLITGTFSSESGNFYIENIFSGQKTVRISLLGYLTREVNLDITRTDIDLQQIVLTEDEHALNEVVIKSSVPVFSRKGNSLIINVADTRLSSTGTAIDVIKQIPGMVIKDNLIEFFGKTKPVIYLNNRKLYDESELRMLQSSEIASVELIVNPGAKYDAEGRAVLLVKTRSNKENGWAVLISECLYQGKYFGDEENVKLIYTHNNLSLFASYNHDFSSRDRNPLAIYTVHADTLWQQLWDIPQTYENRNHLFSAGFDWSITDKQAVGGQYRGTFGNNRVNSTGVTGISADEEIFDEISTGSFLENKPVTHLINAFYIGNYGKSFSLRSDMDYMTTNSKMRQKVNEISSVENRELSFLSQSDFSLYAAKLTMDYRMGETGNSEWGIEYNQITGSGFLINPEQYIKDNVYTNKEEKTAAFIAYKHSFGKWRAEAGIRYEFAHYKSTEDSISRTNTDRASHNFYPNISFSRTIGNAETALSVSRKIKRPSFSQLNNNNYYANRFLTQKGNPFLRDENIWQIDYSVKYKILDLTLGYVYKKNPIGFTMESEDSHSSQTVMSFANYPEYQEFNALVATNLNYKILQTSLSAGLRQPWFKTDYLNENVYRNRTSLSFECFNDIVFPKEYIFSVNFIWQGKYNYYAEDHNEYKSLDLGLRKSFLEKKLSFNLQMYDVFAWIKDKTIVEINNISYIQQSKYETRYLTFTITYQLNNNRKKKYRGENAAEEDIGRL